MVEPTVFNAALHVKYWNRCFKSLLPVHYQSNDSNRMTLAFFILSALDLLGEGADKLTEIERMNYRDWILRCENPSMGGFHGSPNHKFPDSVFRGGNGTSYLAEPTSLTATFFALLSLNFVGKVTDCNRLNILKWMQELQREDGSFGEMLDADGQIRGGRDMRICLCVAAIRWILRGDLAYEEKEPVDINVDALVSYIRNSEAYNGGIGGSETHESHAGYTYCGIACLSYLDRLPPSVSSTWTTSKKGGELRGVTRLDDTIRWLMNRQEIVVSANDKEWFVNYEFEDEAIAHAKKRAEEPDRAPLLEGVTIDDTCYTGTNGRLGKIPDTCYSFWVGGSLEMLGHGDLMDKDGTRRWLCKKTQHMIGGFGKAPGHPPDIYHSYMGLAALAVMPTEGIKPLDAALCVSQEAKDKIAKDIQEYFSPAAHPLLLNRKPAAASETATEVVFQ